VTTGMGCGRSTTSGAVAATNSPMNMHILVPVALF
jgi:hypothetical protein